MDKIWACHKEQGRLKINDSHGFLNFVRGLADTGLELILRKSKSIRSLNQNAYLHGVVIKIIAEETGNDPDAILEFIKIKFLPKFVNINGESALVGGSTSRLSTKEFSELMEEIRAWASIEMGINIPEPNEVEYE